MRARRSFASLWIAGLVTGVLCPACFGAVDQSKPVSPSTSKNHRKAAKKPPLPPLPSGPRGPVPQISLDSMQAVAPHVTYQDGQLTIVAPNSTLADILRAVRKLTGAEMDIPPNATERVVTNLGPGPAPGVVAELLNGSHFNYVLLGAPSDAKTLTRVVLVAKSGPDATAPGAGVVANAASPMIAMTAPTRTPPSRPNNNLLLPGTRRSRLRSNCCRRCSSASCKSNSSNKPAGHHSPDNPPPRDRESRRHNAGRSSNLRKRRNSRQINRSRERANFLEAARSYRLWRPGCATLRAEFFRKLPV
jgi:hypothetical protein